MYNLLLTITLTNYLSNSLQKGKSIKLNISLQFLFIYLFINKKL